MSPFQSRPLEARGGWRVKDQILLFTNMYWQTALRFLQLLRMLKTHLCHISTFFSLSVNYLGFYLEYQVNSQDARSLSVSCYQAQTG